MATPPAPFPAGRREGGSADSPPRVEMEGGGLPRDGSEGAGEGAYGPSQPQPQPQPQQQPRSVSWRPELVSDAWSSSSHGSTPPSGSAFPPGRTAASAAVGARGAGGAAAATSPQRRRAAAPRGTAPAMASGRWPPDGNGGSGAGVGGGGGSFSGSPRSSPAPPLAPEPFRAGAAAAAFATAPLPPGVPPPNPYATEIVRSLFPPTSLHPSAVSPVLADYPCSHLRASGRLYVSVSDVCFYSNLFGRETKIRVELARAATVRDDGRTGVAVQRMEGEGGEEFVFKRLGKRDEVLGLVRRLHARAVGRPASPPPPSAAAAEGAGSAAATAGAPASPPRQSAGSERTASGTAAAAPPQQPPAPRTPPRPTAAISAGAAAASPAAADATGGAAAAPDGSRTKRGLGRSRSADSLPGSRGSPDRSDSSPGLRARSSSDGAADAAASSGGGRGGKAGGDVGGERSRGARGGWEEARSSALADRPEVALGGARLPCSVDAFHAAFLSDSGSHALSQYMAASIGDKDIATSPWRAGADDEGPLETRTVEFRHPLNSAFAPSFVNSKKVQSLRRYPGKGLIMESETTIEGKSVPGAGRFRVEEAWIVEAAARQNGDAEGGAVVLTVRFSVDFDPDVNGALKRMIASRSKSETREWYRGYRTFLLDALEAEAAPPGAAKRPPGIVARSESDLVREGLLEQDRALLAWMGSADLRAFWTAVALAILLLAAPMAAALFHMWGLTDRVAELEAEVAEVRLLLAAAEASGWWPGKMREGARMEDGLAGSVEGPLPEFPSL